MRVLQLCHRKEEFAQRGDYLYKTQIKSQVELGNDGKIVAIALETGDFEVDKSEIAALVALKPVILMLKFGWFPLAHAMFVDVVDG